jgi:hypothetical protein
MNANERLIRSRRCVQELETSLRNPLSRPPSAAIKGEGE